MRARLLIADDHALLRECLRTLIDAQPGFTVVGEAADVRETLVGVRELRPDIVLLDLSMPGGAAVETISRLVSEVPRLRVLVLSMHDDHGFVRATLAAGAAGYVLKRSAYSELVVALKRVRGGALFVDPALRLERDAARAQGTGPPLTPREREVLKLLAGGLSYRDVGERLGMGPRTVETHRRNLADKLGLKTRADLVRYALETGLIAAGQAG